MFSVISHNDSVAIDDCIFMSYIILYIDLYIYDDFILCIR